MLSQHFPFPLHIPWGKRKRTPNGIAALARLGLLRFQTGGSFAAGREYFYHTHFYCSLINLTDYVDLLFTAIYVT